ncbi:hemin uptake protein HemP [Paracoccus sp. (in: a-proteobacteria)]|uniref:hemin uptake protein HemP n=1 Tax=Paracoccus sp. TaxID=267 RepID=UPI0026E06776|nr:hemin uptake protein HemP [Paracoccus sp. (in: a-proteobacteria)]MDO5371323.1 hemin uptake protein HemP [Paracoccus sp. (in: a-proteobacteria)]
MNDLTFHGSDPTPVQVRLQAPLHDATTLTAGGHLAQIALADQIYTLRITRAGKLILTK